MRALLVIATAGACATTSQPEPLRGDSEAASHYPRIEQFDQTTPTIFEAAAAGSGGACQTTAPLTVEVENRTPPRIAFARTIDLCASFERVRPLLTWPSALTPLQGYALRVVLEKTERRRDRGEQLVECGLSIHIRDSSQFISMFSGGASVTGLVSERPGPLARECIDAVMNDMLERKVLPAIQQRLATTAAAGAGSATSLTTPANPTP